MLICPFDMHWCQRAECRTGICKFAPDAPLTACDDCGEPIERFAADHMCSDCLHAGNDPAKGG